MERSLEHLTAIEAKYAADVAAVRAHADEVRGSLAASGMRLDALATLPAAGALAADIPADDWTVDDLPLGGSPQDVQPAPAKGAEGGSSDAFAADDDGIPIWQD